MLLLLALCFAWASLVVTEDSATYLGKIYEVPSELPTPYAFFPLTEGFGQTVSAWPGTSINGYFQSASPQTVWWATDDLFGATLSCNKTANASVILPSLQFASEGPFSISMWFKPDVASLTGPYFEYLYSQSAYGLNNTQPAFAPNSINIYLPAQEHPAFGLIRTIIKDSNDLNTTTYLDSDGQYSSNAIRTLQGATNVEDGQWHSFTVTSQPDNVSGYIIYIDGISVAELPLPGNTSTDVDGGGPFDLSGEAVLCSRDSLSLDGRYYSGSLAHLTIFSQALSESQVLALHNSVDASDTAAIAETPTLTPSPPVSSPTSSSEWLNQFQNASNLEVVDGTVQICTTSETENSYCSSGYTCTPLSNRQLSLLGDAFEGQQVGVCSTDALLQLDSVNVTAAVYFPLGNFSVQTWPVPEFTLSNSSSPQEVSWVDDSLFGSAIQCPGDAAMQFDPPMWGTNGAWAFNVWIQQSTDSGELFQYVVSARDSSNGPIENTTDIYQQNDLHIYLPEANHPAHGTVRVIAKDNTDTYSSARDESYLDSDGVVGSNAVRDTPRLNLTDGLWHMITVTTLPAGGKGFQIFVDGMYMAALMDPESTFAITAGQGIAIDGPITLCGRSDLGSNRFFNGKIAQFSMFDSALSNTTVGELYGLVYSNITATTILASSIGRESITLSESSDLEDSNTVDRVFSAPIGATGIGLQESEETTSSVPAGQFSETQSHEDDSPHRKLSPGGKAGIVIGSIVGAVLLVALTALVAVKVRRGRRMSGVHRLQEVSHSDVMPDQEMSLKLSSGKSLDDRYLFELVRKNTPAPQNDQDPKISTKVHNDEPDLL